MILCFAALLLFDTSSSYIYHDKAGIWTGVKETLSSSSSYGLLPITTAPDPEEGQMKDNDVASRKRYDPVRDGSNIDRQETEDKFDGSQNKVITQFDYGDFITGPTQSLLSPEPPGQIEEIVSSIDSDSSGQLDLVDCLARERKFEDSDSTFELEVKRRIFKLTARYQRLRSHKPLVKHQLRNRLSILRRILGNIGQDPGDVNVEEGDLDTKRPISLRFIKALNNVAGETSTVLGYLLAFGYLQKAMKLSESRLQDLDKWDELATPCQIEKAIGEFQKFNGLAVTNKLDYSTIKKLKKDRCGMRDIPSGKNKRKNKLGRKRKIKNVRSKRYVLRKRAWKTGTPKKELTYHVKNCTSTMPLDVCKREIEEGIKRWTEVAPIFFREVGKSEAEEADFTIFFVSGEHPKKNISSPKNDDPFDGPGGVVGHAYFPRGGHIHFDNDETYSWNSDRGINLRFFVVHEFGHALGLEHSDVTDTVMIPVYDAETKGWSGSDRLFEDDILGIRKKYGVGKGSVRTLKAG